jgi:pimeloyl-ACP methyl ester carboxylesterase/DNA-binding NarL/FixJ family response regulator
MVVPELSIHQIISLIYESAIDVEKWPELLDAIAHVTQQETKPTPPRLPTGQAKGENASLADALQNLGQQVIAVEHSPFAGNEKEEIDQLLLVHFNKAMSIASKLLELHEQQEAARTILNHLPIGLLVLDGQCNVIESNRYARDLIAANNLLQIRDGRLLVNESKDAIFLRQVVKKLSNPAAIFSASEAVTLSGTNSSHESLMLIISPCQANSLSDHNHVTLFISSKEEQAITLPVTVKHHYDLSGREFMLAGMMVRGFTIKEAAEKSQLTEHTIRTQLKAVFAKTNTSRQAELIALLLGGVGTQLGYGLLTENRNPHCHRETATTAKFLKLRDGRRLSYQEYGAPEGEAVFYCHSVFGSQLELAFYGSETAAARGIRLIIPDRPGCGHSSPNPGTDLLEWTNDLRELADHLALPSFDMIGYAMGGLFAYATAFTLPERVRQVVLISAGTSPQSAEDFHDMQPLFRMTQKLARDFPRMSRLVFSLMVKSMKKNPALILERMAQKVCASDSQILRHQDFLSAFTRNINLACSQGASHMARELELAMHPQHWGFTPQEIATPITMWHGREDNSLPFILSEKFQRLAPNATLHALDGKGHYAFYDHWPLFLDQLLQTRPLKIH